MPKRRDSGTTILLGLKGYKVGEVRREGDRVTVEMESREQKDRHCGSRQLYSYGMNKPRQVLHMEKYPGPKDPNQMMLRWCGGETP